MEYRINYRFFKDWLEENGNNQSYVLQKIGSQDYSSLRKWLRGEAVPKIELMVKLCNMFNIPLSCFFRNLEKTKYDDTIRGKMNGDILIPINKNIKARKTSEVEIDPNEKVDSIIPKKYLKLKLKNKKVEKEKIGDDVDIDNMMDQEVVLVAKYERQYNQRCSELLKREEEWGKQREQFLKEFNKKLVNLEEINKDKDLRILEKDKRIDELTKVIINMKQGGYPPIIPSNTDMVSEEPHE